MQLCSLSHLPFQIYRRKGMKKCKLLHHQPTTWESSWKAREYIPLSPLVLLRWRTTKRLSQDVRKEARVQ